MEAWLAEGQIRNGVRDWETLRELSQDPFLALSPAERVDRALVTQLERQSTRGR